MWLSSFVSFLQSLPHAGPTGSLKPLGLLVGEQERPFPPTQCKPQRGGKKQGGEAIPNSSGAAAQGTGARRSQLCHTAPAPPSLLSHGTCGSWAETWQGAVWIRARRCSSPAGTKAKPILPVPAPGEVSSTPNAQRRAGSEAGSHSEVARASLGTGRTQRKKITHFNKEMCTKRETLRSCQHEHRQR